jgi:ribosomal protein S18 acetylase RimI-like enzyme
MEHIRKACYQDLPYLYRICLKTALSGLDGTDYFHDPFCVGHYYAAPYLFFEPETCFVALDGNDIPCGYIVGTSDTVAFTQWMNTTWLPPLRPQYLNRSHFKCKSEELINQLICKGPGEGVWEHVGYPAHMHINLLPEIQGKGLGKGLMLSFFGALKEKGVYGVHLGVDGHNTHAIGFYEKMGMTVLKNLHWGTVYGKQLD